MSNTAFVSAYVAISILFASVNFIVGSLALTRKSKLGFSLGIACYMAGITNLSYLLSTMASRPHLFSVLSSVYFLSIDYMLVSLLEFCVCFARYQTSRRLRLARTVIRFYALFDTIVFFINPVHNIAISYLPSGEMLPHFIYDFHPLYVAHLVYSYFVIAVIVVLLVIKLTQVPKEYRVQYLSCLGSIGVIVALNAVFLYIPLPSVISKLDLSVFCYTFGLILLYWNSMQYSSHGMMDIFRNNIFENIMQGIVLFDYSDCLRLSNSRVAELFPRASLSKGMTFNEFLVSSRLDQELEGIADDASIQCYVRQDAMVLPVRCDHTILRNKHGQKFGRLLVFTGDTDVEDLLTGFHSWDDFQRVAPINQQRYVAPATVAVVDINGLTMLNKTSGRAKGDQAIQELAGLMRQHFPKQTYFIRGQDANLIALASTTSTLLISECLEAVERDCSSNIIYSISGVNDRNPNVLAAISDALTGLKAKKLMDKESIHSQLLTSLMRALEECDSDTEAHVKRTQKLGEMLGRRIGLSDVDQSQLSLLCMLHDIGKIGIPLEILNKPGKLTGPEWRTIQSHVEKGYQIALSVEELSGIADIIRHHHERWDGKGYPDGLAGESIPLLSRIISVVDAYDAMTNNRSYRRALTVSKAVNELKRGSGLQFDPRLVSEFLQIIPLTGVTEEVDEEEAEAAVYPTSSAVPDLQADSVHAVMHCAYTLDNRMYIINADEHFQEMTGYTLEEVTARKMMQFDLIPPEDRAEYQAKVSDFMKVGPSAYLEHRLLRKDGTVTYVFCYGKTVFDSVSRTNHTEIVISNVSSTYSFRAISAGAGRIANAEHWDQASRRDALTALLNPEAFRSDVEESMLAHQKKLLMLMIDVDKFKEYNAVHGQRAGDSYLISVSQALSGALRREDLACRIGGDEFAAVVFFDSDTSDEVINRRAKQIYDKICLTLTAIRGTGSLSMGAAVSSEGLDSFSKLFEASDRALFSSKQAGRSKITIYTPAE